MKSIAEKTPIKTFIRIKPSNERCTNLATTNETVKFTKSSGETLEYTLDTVFSHSTSQKRIFDKIKPAIKDIIKGVNSSVFCYGNTGSGKTFTMLGTKKYPGIIVNFITTMFEYFESVQGLYSVKTSFTYFQIYNEKVYDMFTNKELCLREFNDEVIIKGLTQVEVKDKTEFQRNFEIANKNRKVGNTALNESSSRSHTIIRLDCFVDGKKSHVYLIDLAGSENNKKTGNAGLRLVESSNINKSLFVLNQVVNAILSKSASIPFRDSKLTRVLKDSLGGSSVCYIIGCVEPQRTAETYRTLEFVSKSRKIICEVKSAIDNRVSEKTKTLYDQTRKKMKDNDRVPFSSIKNAEGAYKPFVNNLCVFKNKEIPCTKSYNNTGANLKRTILGEKNVNAIQNKLYKNFEADYIGKKMHPPIHKTEKDCLSPFCITNILSKEKKLEKSINTEKQYTKREILEMLNSDNFINIKKIKGIGDKRASALIEYVKINGKITDIEQLRSIFSQKVYQKIFKETIDV